ncbi:MAG: hypothetical protein ACTTJ3_07365 [Treponema sp.]
MKILIENTGKEFIFSDFLYCTSSNVKVSNNFYDYAFMYGQYYANGSATVAVRTFTIQGNFEAESNKDVEHLRGEVFSSLFNNKLLLFLEDDSERFYRCVLDGNVGTTYNQGWNVGRVFTLSFTLTAYLPFAYERNTYTSRILVDQEGIFKVNYLGTAPCMPIVKFNAKKNIVLTSSKKPLISGNKTIIKLKKDITLDSGDELKIKEGIAFLNNKLLDDVLDPISMLKPLFLVSGDNLFLCDKNAFALDAGSLYFSWQNVYF